jgi:co-chaperonin GroES (HSP10)
MSELKLAPWGDRVYLILEERVTKVGGIEIPDNASQRSRIAVVAAFGDRVTNFAIGDRVLISWYTGVFVHLPDFAFRAKEDLHRIVREDEILAKLL